MGATLENAKRRLRGLLVSAAVLGAIALAAVVYRTELLAWFRGEGGGGAWSAPGRVVVGTMAVDTSVQPDVPRTSGNRVRVELADEDGAPLASASVKVTAFMAAMGAMPEMKSTVPATPRGAGRYDTPAFDLPMAGTWEVIVDIEREGKTATARYSMTIGIPGLQLVGGEGGETPATRATSAIAAQTYPPPTFTALRAAFESYDRVRSRLAESAVDQHAAHQLAALMREARTDGVPHEVTHALEAGGAAAARIAATTDVEVARVAFAEASEVLVALAAADPRLSATWRVFECPMAPGYKRWAQREPAPANPYFGTAMAACVSPIEWMDAPAPPVAAIDRVTVDESRRTQIGVTTTAVSRRAMTLDIRAAGRLTYDERRLTDVTLKVGGYVTDLRVNASGQAVRKGQVLFSLYSPELYAAQQELIMAHANEVTALAAATEKRLRLWGITATQIAAILAKGEPIEQLPIASPASGYVIEKEVVEGAAVEAGMRLFRIAALDTIWVEADLHEADLAHVKRGTPAEVALTHISAETRTGNVTFVYPYLDPMTRTGRVRIELANRGAALKPDMFATVTFHVPLGERVQVPRTAIIYTGRRRVVFVDEGGGVLRAQEITVGVESGDSAEVLTGLAPGDVVVTSGNFLVAAESRLRSTSGLWTDAP